MSYQNNIPQLRFAGFVDEWEKSNLNKFASLNPKNSVLPESFIYIDLESVTDGLLIKESVISKNEAPSRAQRILKDKDILYQTVRPYQKNNLYFDKVGDYVASTGYAQIRTINDSQFLFQFLHTEKFVANVMLRCTGTSYPAINSSDLSSIEISFPTLPEQQKIASFLSAVDEKIQQLSRKKELLEQYKKGVMQQLFSGKLRFKDENGKDYADWEEKKLKDITNPITKGTTPKKFDKEGVNFIKIEGLDGINFNESKCLFINPKIHLNELKRSILKENDILFAIAGSVGKVGIVSAEILPANTNQAFAIIRLKDERWLLFIFQLLTSKLMKNYIYQNMSVGAQPNLNLEQMGNFTFKSPQIEEQQKIANFLSSIDIKIESTNQQITQMQSFKKGLLQQMFV